MHVVARRPHRELHRAAQKFKLRHYFLLTRVTRIFQKSVFTKAAPSSPGKTPLPGFFVARRERHIAHGSTATFECGTWPRAEFHCFRIVIYNEFCKSDVLPARILFSAHAKR